MVVVPRPGRFTFEIPTVLARSSHYRNNKAYNNILYSVRYYIALKKFFALVHTTPSHLSYSIRLLTTDDASSVI